MNEPDPAGRCEAFPITPWSLILSAPGNLPALDALLRKYVEPLRLRAMRHHGLSPEAAQDAVQNLCISLLKEDSPLRTVHPAQGKFRAWLSACLRHTVANTVRRENAARRGGGAAHAPLDEGTAASDPSEAPDAAYDRAWARQVYANVEARFLGEVEEGSRAFEIRRVCLGGKEAEDQACWERLGISRATFYRDKKAAAARFGELLRAEVAATLSDPRELEEELRALMQWLG